MPKTALIAGATGLIGKHCLSLLLASENYHKVICLTRRAMSSTHPKLESHVIDFDQLDQNVHLIKANDIYCCLGTTIKKTGSQQAFRKVDFEYSLAIAKAASTNGAEQFLLVTALGANAKSSIFYNRVKGEVEDAIRQLKFNSIHFFRPSILLGDREEFRLGEVIGKIVANAVSFALIGSFKKYRGIEGSVVAQAMLHIASQNRRGVHFHESDQIQLIFDNIEK